MAGTEEATEVHEVNITEKSDRILKLPLTRIKNIIKVDPDVTLTSTESVVLIAKATELFIQDLVKEACVFTAQGKRKTVQKKDLELAVEQVDSLVFLEGALEW